MVGRPWHNVDSVILKYRDALGAIHKQSVPFLSVKGFDEPDKFQMVPPIINDIAFGAERKSQFIGFRRIITIDCGVIQDVDVHIALLGWMQNNIRSVYLGVTAGREEEIFVVPEFEYESEWIDDCKLGKRFVLPVTENCIRNAWSDYTPASGIDIMYCKLKVKIEGTPESPETFTTNVGKLALMETGLAFPAISLLSWVASIQVNGAKYQSATFRQVGAVTNSGTNLTFQLCIDEAGNPSTDGYFYADILFLLQPIP